MITGASQGSGKATAILFASKGYDVIMVARQPERLAAAAAQVQREGTSAVAIPGDVGDIQQVRAIVQKALDACGNIDVLVNNAGICLAGAIEHTTSEDWQKLMNTNFWGCVNTIQEILPHFLERKTGTIVNVGSIGGKMPLPQMTAYCASKYAVTGLTETLRLELAPHGIHVCAVHPGLINSDFLERAQFRDRDEPAVELRRQQMTKMVKSEWATKPEDIARSIWDAVKNQHGEVTVGPAFLASEAYRLFPGLMQWAMAKGN
ncbi:SDR family oxidoreductase [Microcoleus sp. F4-D5]|uniref:SDR family oxidoreductase n=1 Tax=Microcoleus sp. F4-D5 TaxID=2818760 RepID=UPI002FD0C2C7